MKKAVVLMIAAIMIMGSLKVFAADVTAGKLDAVAQDRLEFQSTVEDIQLQINQIYSMQDELGTITRPNEESVGASQDHGVIKELGWEAELQTQKLDRIKDSLDLQQAEKMKKDMVVVLKDLKEHAAAELRAMSNY
jgi:hypothetical protein